MAAAADIRLRRWHPGDAAALTRYANNHNVSRSLGEPFPFPYTNADAEAWIALCNQTDEPVLNFAIDLSGEAIGSIGFVRLTDVRRLTAEIGYWIGEPFWGRGIATTALVAATTYGFDALGLARIQAGVFEGNPASARVLEKAGYTLEGRLLRSIIKEGRILDSLLYSRIR
ncbi:MAG TPA: GNAT family protein [Candidatus Binataceae bacterium]|nr:GNAT family protein [Candidatus Binataceae bacterium]